MKDFYEELVRIVPTEREDLLKVVREAERVGRMKMDSYEFLDVHHKIPKRILLVVRAPQGQWIGTVLRPSQARAGWESFSVNITPEDLGRTTRAKAGASQ